MLLSDTSTARLSLVKQAGKDNTVPATPAWLNLPVTSIGLNEQLDSSDSEVLRPDRQYANARITGGSSGGDLPVEAAYDTWMDTLLLALMQSSASTLATGESAYNESTKHYFSMEKYFKAGDGDVYQWYKDLQLNSGTLNFDANAFVGSTFNVMGLEVEPLGAVPKTGATYTDVDMSDQFDTNSVTWVLKDKNGTVIDTELNSGSLEMSNNLRKQPAVGKYYGAGNASSRFSCMVKAELYFSNRKIYEGFKANDKFTVEITLTTPAGNSYLFVMNNCKATTYDDNIGGVDSDIMISAAFRANADDSTPSRSVTLTKTDAV